MPPIQPIREKIIEIDRFLDILHADNLQERMLFIAEEITDETAEYFLRNLFFLAKKKSKKQGHPEINVIINCPGGDEYAGLAMYNGVKTARNRGYKVNGIVIGECCSMAPIVLQAFTKRQAHKYTRFMVHESAYIEETWEKVADLKDRAMRAEEMEQWLSEVMAERSKLNADEWRLIIHKIDHYFFADKALEYGLIDEII